MKVVELRTDGTGVAELDGTRQEVNLALVEDPHVGEHVIVHAGFAIERLDEREADERLALFAELAAELAAEPADGHFRDPASMSGRSVLPGL
jgi:hydrogenase expression/formation protein HypC